jgi:hypothetical protein
MLLSESARMSSASETRFRVQSSNSQPRSTKLIALDVRSDALLERLAARAWNHATFLSASKFGVGLGRKEYISTDGWLTDLAGRPKNLEEQVGTADLVAMIATAGENAWAAASIGSACSLRRVNTAAFIFGAASASDADISESLVQLRPWSLMVVIAGADDYIEDMMVALRA